nr:hypothetical protein [Marinicella sp. W31]MDC2877425.1 hypothetical protein [Marinicella sp. W31]
MDSWLTGKMVRRRFYRLRFAAAIVLLILTSAGTFAAWKVVNDRTRDYVQSQATETLAVQAEVLNGVLEKYRLIPPLLARQDEVALLFASLASDISIQKRARSLAEEIAGLSGARDVAFFAADGKLIAAARDIFGDEPAGRAELLRAANENRLGRTIALIKGKAAFTPSGRVSTGTGSCGAWSPSMSVSMPWSVHGRFLPIRFS